MTTQQIKAEISRVLDQVPESVLESVLEYLNSLKNKSVDELKKAQELSRILEEDKELLEKLAK